MRLFLTEESRLKVFCYLKEKFNCKTYKELSKKIKIPFKTLQKWKLGDRYLPDSIIPQEILPHIKALDSQEDNWGAKKAGKIGGKKSYEILKKKLGKEKYSEMMRARGKKTINTLLKRYGKEELTKMAVAGKIRKREKESKLLEESNKSFFTNQTVKWDIQQINCGLNDKKKRIIFPTEMNEELAEEIGIHLGDGYMSYNRNYFSVKTNKKEKEYMAEYLFPLYKRLYNLNLKMMNLPSVVGFEVYSKGLCEFKNKILGVPYGEKVHKIEIPKAILDTKNKEVYSSLIRGLFDTDGCVCTIKKNKKYYPIISITVKSEKLIRQASEMLRLMGFIPYSNNKSYISLNGRVMLKKWIKEIGSNNLKNINKLERARSITG